MRHVILNLHGLGDPGRPLDDPAEGRYWVTPEVLNAAVERCQALSGQIGTAFTFDDGNRSDIEIGAPILEAVGQRATFFVLADRIGSPHSLSAEDMRRLVAAGHRIGCHGAAHVDWTVLDETGLTRELITARAIISKAANCEVKEAALPFGRYNARVLRALRRAGYARVYSSDGGAVRGSRWPVPRTSLTHDMAGADIDDILLGREPMRQRLRRGLARAIKTRF